MIPSYGSVILGAFATLAVAACGAQGSANPPQVASSAQAVAQAPCANSYMPVKAGAKWIYASKNNVTGASTTVNTITVVGADHFTLKVDTGGSVGWTETWTCTQDGLLQLQNNGGAISAATSGPDGKATVTTKSNIGITVPINPKTGDTWSQTTEVEVSGSGVKITVKTTTNSRVVGSESVTVPAGTFDATRVESTVQGVATFQDGRSMPTESTSTSWWVPGTGMVKGISSTGSVDSQVDLKSFQIP